jgi:hypothetical protein
MSNSFNSFTITRFSARIPDAIDLNDVALNERSLTQPNPEDVVSGLERLPVDNPPQSNIGLSNDVPISDSGIQVNRPDEPVPVVIAQRRQDQPPGLPVLTNNQLSASRSVCPDDACEELKDCCREYWQCVKTDDRCVQRARCGTFHGASVGLTVASGGLYAVGLGLVYCCWMFVVSGGNRGGGNNPCSPSTFSKSCLPDC